MEEIKDMNTIIGNNLLKLRKNMKLTQMEVADEIGISQAQVSRLEKTALEHMRRLYK